MKLLGKIKNFLQESVAPTVKCLNCGADVFDGSGFCANCQKQVPYNNGKTCHRCGTALFGEEDYCGHCAFEKNYFDRCYSPFRYEGVVQKAILDMKFHGIATNAKVLARHLVACAKQNQIEFDVVTFVPMTKSAQKQRGYNQSQLLAEYFCDIMQREGKRAILLPALSKVKETDRQEKLNKQQRMENLVGAFAADQSVKDKRVLLVDDIKTTGSTINQCAKALKRKGATQVVGLTVASRSENLSWEIFEDNQ